MPAVFDPNIGEEAAADEHSALVDIARKAGKNAYDAKAAEVGDAGAAGFVTLHLPVDKAHKPLLGCLSENSVGGVGGWSFDYEITAFDILAKSMQSMEVQTAVLEAFAVELRNSGFESVIKSRAD